MSLAENPRATPGDNLPDYLQETLNRLHRDHAELKLRLSVLAMNVQSSVPGEVTSDEDLESVAKGVVEIRDEIERLKEKFKVEKEPYLRGGQAVDQFFKDLADELKKVQGEVAARGKVFTDKKIAAERERLRQEEVERRRTAEEADARARKLSKEAAEAEAAANRARNPGRVEALSDDARKKMETAADARVESQVAAIDANAARNAVEARSADIGRVRFSGTGRMATVRQVGYVELLDAAKVDLEALRPYFKPEHLLAAGKTFGKQTNHKVALRGFLIEMRDEAVYK